MESAASALLAHLARATGADSATELAVAVRAIVEVATADSPTAAALPRLKTSLDRGEFLVFDVARFSSDAADGLMQLRPATRKKLVSGLQAATNADSAAMIAAAFRTLQGVAGLPQRLGKLESMTAQVLERQERILEELGELRGRLETIDAKLDEQVLVDVRRGLHHLVSAANSGVEQVRSQQLQLASAAFTALTQLDERGITRGISGSAPNSSLVVLGHWGNHLYFQMQGDSRNALLEVYASARRFPRESAVVFPAEYFTRDYESAFRSLKGRLAAAQRKLEQTRASNAKRASAYEGRQLLRGVGALALGLAAGTVGGALTTLVGFGPSGGVLGVQAARAFMQAGGSAPNPSDTASLEAEVARYRAAIETLTAELREECAARTAVLQAVTLDDLRRGKVPRR